MASIANVALTDTFDTWRIRTNEVINKIDQFETEPVYIVSKSNNVIQIQGVGTLGNTVNITSNAFAVTGGTITGNTTFSANVMITGGVLNLL